MRKITALFTAVSGWPTGVNIQSLRDSGNAEYTIVGVDCKPNVASLNYVDYLYAVPRCNDPRYVERLLELCEYHNVDIIIPLISEDIGPLSKNRKRFEDIGTKILLSDEDSLIDIANDKLRLQNFLEEHGVYAMPRSVKLNLDTLDADLESFGYLEVPIAVKMKDACGAIGFKILDENKAKGVNGLSSRENRANPYITKQQLLELPQLDRYILQEYLPGRECGALCLVDHGRTIYCVTHEDYEMQFAITTECELTDDQDVREIVTAANSLLKLTGNIGYDFKRDKDGRVRLLECNPRVSATVCLPAKAGLNIMEMGIFQRLGILFREDIQPLYGLRMQRVYGALYTYEGKPYA